MEATDCGLCRQNAGLLPRISRISCKGRDLLQKGLLPGLKNESIVDSLPCGLRGRESFVIISEKCGRTVNPVFPAGWGKAGCGWNGFAG